MRTPNGAIKVYDKDGNCLGFQFRSLFDKISYDIRKKDRINRKKRKENESKN
jgi:hypothetical protein